MPREQARRYVEALWYSVHVQDAEFGPGDAFAGWWARHGYLFHQTIEDAWLNWYALGFPHGTEDNQQ